MKLRMGNRSHDGGNIEPGTFAWYIGKSDGTLASDGLAMPQAILFVCLNGKRQCRIEVTTGPAQHPQWHWDGNLDEPTITPSIGCDHRCGFHGHLIRGELLPV